MITIYDPEAYKHLHNLILHLQMLRVCKALPKDVEESLYYVKGMVK